MSARLRIVDFVRVLGAAMLLTFTVACEKSSLISLKNPSQFQVHEVTAPQIDQELPPTAFNDKLYSSNNLHEFDKSGALWIRFAIDPINFPQPTVFLKRCWNVAAVAVDSNILYRASVHPETPINFANFKQPFIALPGSKVSHLSVLLKRTMRAGLTLDCADILIGDEANLIRHFSYTNAPELLVGTLFFILAIVLLFSWKIHQDKSLMLAGVFYLFMGGYFVFNTQVLHFINLNNREVFNSYTFCLFAAPILILAFLYRRFDQRYQALPIVAFLNFLIAVAGFSLLMFGLTEAYLVVRKVYTNIVLVELVCLLPFMVVHILHSKNTARRLFWIGLIGLILGLGIDTLSRLFFSDGVHATAAGGMFYIFCAMTSFSKERFFNIYNVNLQNRNDVEEYTLRLEAEVRTRELRLRERNRILEESNVELEEKNILLRLAFKRLDDLLLQQGAMLKKASKIKNSILLEIVEKRELTRVNFDRDSLRNLSLSVHKLASALDPFARLHDDIEAVNNKLVWILMDNREVATSYKHALNSSKLRVHCFDNADELKLQLKEEQPKLLVICSSQINLVQEIHSRHPDIQIILSGEGEFNSSIDFLRDEKHLNHLIFQQHEPTFFMQRNLIVTSTKILSNDVFGIEKYLDWGVDIKETIITGNNSRSRALEQLDQDLLKAGLSSTMTRKAHHLADELLMNAIYDAPVDPVTKVSRYNHLTRSVSVELEPSEYARLRYGYDGTVLALSIDDPFGGLGRDVILKYLKACFDGQFGKINENEGKGGGGMGLYQILTSADLLVTNMKPGKKTEIIALLNVHEKSHDKGQCFHYFLERDTP
jgi:hypothetical protein